MIDIKNINEFEDLLKSNPSKTLVLKFSEPWCGPCKIMAPVYDNAAVAFNTSVANLNRPELSNQVIFCTIDRGECRDVIEKYNLGTFTIPRIILIKIDQEGKFEFAKDLGGTQGVDRLISSIAKTI